MKLARKQFYFIRHGQTDWNVQKRTAGHDQVPLNETGRAQAESLQDVLTKLHPPVDHVFYSPTLRAKETEQIAAKKLSCPKTALDDLKEWNYGDWIGQFKDEYIKAHYMQIEPPHGEKREDFFARVVAAVNGALQESESPLIVAHLGNYWALADAMKLPAVPLNNCQLITFKPMHESWQQELLTF
jgi:probable phosphoglycerate mutase